MQFVRKWHGTDITAVPNDVRFRGRADIHLNAAKCPVMTQSGHRKAQILEFDRLINAWHRSNEASKRLDEIPGVGPALATALVASVGNPRAFRSGRDFSTWIGLVPKQNSSGSKTSNSDSIRSR